VDAEGSATYQRLAEDFPCLGIPMDIHQYNWTRHELLRTDLFGRVRSLKDQALEQYFATSQARRATQLSLVAEVASNYLTPWPRIRERLKLAKETLESQETSYRLIRSRYEAASRLPSISIRPVPAWNRRGWTLPAIPRSRPRTKTP
jgi:multidrug efflux system outer membrane protein